MMKKILDLLISPKTTAVSLLLFAIAMGSATFIEDKYDTQTAYDIVYGTKWFELLMLLLAVNFVGNIKRFKLYRKEKIGNLTFHLAFILIILGAGITRYYGYEGMMRIREGQSSNEIFMDQTYLKLKIEDSKQIYEFTVPVTFKQGKPNDMDVKIDTKDFGEVEITYQDVIPNAVEKITENQPDGVNSIEIIAAQNKQRVRFNIKEGEFVELGTLKIANNSPDTKGAVQLVATAEGFTVKSPYEMMKIASKDANPEIIAKDSLLNLGQRELLTINNEMFYVERKLKKATKTLVPGKMANGKADAVKLNVAIKGKTHQITLFGGKGHRTNFQLYNLDGAILKMTYGDLPIKLPFSLKLDDFILTRYAGSMSPSSYESRVSLIDKKEGINEKQRIYMNHVLDYKGYRFFQSSYDQDEKGTVLSVNHDAVGTWVSYIGYALLALGFLFIFFSKESRFTELRRRIVKVQQKRKKLLMTAILLVLGTLGVQAQNTAGRPISTDHANLFGELVVQTFNGRFAPVQTLADDVLHKISRLDKIKTQGKGTFTKMQAFLDMQIDPDFWKIQKMFYVREKPVQKVLGISGKYAAFADFFDADGNYKLQKYAEKAFRTPAAERNKFDKEVIKVDERVNVFMMTLNGSITKIYPVQNSANHKWTSWTDSLATKKLTGKLAGINEELQLKDFSFRNIMQAYYLEVIKSVKSGDYTIPNKIVGYIRAIQKDNSDFEGFPSENQLKYEVFYNNANIFTVLKHIYSVLSLLLLIFAFTENLQKKKRKLVSLILNGLIGLLGIAFLYHSFGMGLRWYLTGHAPWSNGYEALILVAWGALLAGFVFMKNSKIATAASALLAFFILMTAGHSSYDPQLTNLQPVLKSYWLIIHVAVLTVSYGFLGSSFLLGMILMVLYVFRNNKNTERFSLVIEELSYINEMNMSLGVFLATVGTFLGGVWANESWGRYWSWDAKETWALVIVISYAIVLHLRMIPKIKNMFFVNAGSVLAFGSVLMTFVGVNYYLSKGMHSYGAGSTPVFPIWAWALIVISFSLIGFAGYKELRKDNPVGGENLTMEK